MTPERPVRPAKPIKSTQNGSKNRHSDAPTRSNHAASGQTERSSRCPGGKAVPGVNIGNANFIQLPPIRSKDGHFPEMPDDNDRPSMTASAKRDVICCWRKFPSGGQIRFSPNCFPSGAAICGYQPARARPDLAAATAMAKVGSIFSIRRCGWRSPGKTRSKTADVALQEPAHHR